jgi:hypothetical protein
MWPWCSLVCDTSAIDNTLCALLVGGATNRKRPIGQNATRRLPVSLRFPADGGEVPRARPESLVAAIAPDYE